MTMHQYHAVAFLEGLIKILTAFNLHKLFDRLAAKPGEDKDQQPVHIVITKIIPDCSPMPSLPGLEG